MKRRFPFILAVTAAWFLRCLLRLLLKLKLVPRPGRWAYRFPWAKFFRSEDTTGRRFRVDTPPLMAGNRRTHLRYGMTPALAVVAAVPHPVPQAPVLPAVSPRLQPPVPAPR